MTVRLPREHGATLLVTALGSAFGITLLGTVSLLTQMSRAQHPTASGTADGNLVLTMLAVVFVALSVYVGGIVTANTFSTIIAGRTRSIALLRLLGDTAQAQRRVVVREGARIGSMGALLGAVIGLALEVGFIRILVFRGLAPDTSYDYVSPTMLLPVVSVVIATVFAARIGSRGVLRVRPIEATAASLESSPGTTASLRHRTILGLALFVTGAALLGVGIVVGLTTPAAVLIGLVGGIISFSGVMASANVVMPACLRVVGRALGRGTPARLAAANAVRYPDRSARSTIGLVVAVTLVTTFAVALTTFQKHILAAGGDASSFDQIVIVLISLTGFSSIIAAVGLVNTLSLSVHQRQRELGLLRTLGCTSRQIRLMIFAESTQMAITSVVVGLVLGVFYGWCGAQATLGSISHDIVAPVLPIPLTAGLTVAAFTLSAIASLAPSRRATRVSPVEALRVV